MQVLLRRALRMRGRAQVKPRYRPRPEERGVAMVEFAVILPVLAMLVVGVVEIGFAFKEKLLVDNAIQVAARTGSVLGQSDDVDLRILEALEQGFASLPARLAISRATTSSSSASSSTRLTRHRGIGPITRPITVASRSVIGRSGTTERTQQELSAGA